MRQIWHPWHEWECHAAGFYRATPPDGMDANDAREAYRAFLADPQKFWDAMQRVAAEWPVSCEHFLTKPNINRVAWLGQAAMCISTGVSSVFRGGFKLLTPAQQNAANATAARFLTWWLREKEREDQAVSGDLDEAGLSGGHPGHGADGVDATTVGPVVQGDLFRVVAE